MPSANTYLSGYMRPVGPGKIETVVDHTTPTSYTSGAAEVINALDLGLGGIEDVMADAISAGGNYFVRINLPLSGKGNAVPAFGLRWYVVAGGAEANGSLTADTIRLRVRGV